MSIRRAYRLLPAIDWHILAAAIRLRRAGGWCERCRRPHGKNVYHLDDGRWWDASVCAWRDGDGRVLRVWPPVQDLSTIAVTRVVLAKVHRDREMRKATDANLAALCQRCHMLHGRPAQRCRRWRALIHRLAPGQMLRRPYQI